MADPSPDKQKRKPTYTKDVGAAGAFEGETVTRRRFMTRSAMAFGGIATAAFALPGLGFVLGPQFEDSTSDKWQDVGAEDEFNAQTYAQKIMSIVPNAGEAGKSTVYVRK